MDAVHADISAAIGRMYPVEPVAIVDGPRGFVAETFVVDCADGRRLFAKWLPLWPDLAAVAGALPVLEELHALGIDTVTRPVRTRAGELTADLHGRMLVVFDFIEGRTGSTSDDQFTPASFDYDFDEYVALLARIHTVTPLVGSPMPREDFSLPFAGRYEQLSGQVLSEPPSTPPQAILRRLMEQRREEMDRDWATLRTLVETCRNDVWTPVLTHGDGGGNNVLTGTDGRLYLIDWDSLMLGPPERDTWFYMSNPTSEAEFCRRYRQVFPEYRTDPARYRYYLFRRFFEDLLGYVANIVESSSVEQQAWNFAELEQTCYRWLWPAMRNPHPLASLTGPPPPTGERGPHLSSGW
jgi:spectinomycin phosphotransferase